MSTDPTTVDLPTTAAPLPSSTRPPRRRRRRCLLGAAASVLAVAAIALTLAASGDGPADRGRGTGTISREAAGRSGASTSATTSTTSAPLTSVGAQHAEPSDGGDAAGVGPSAPSSGPLALAPASGLDFLVGTDEMAMSVRNDGNLAADWAIELSNPEVTVSPSEGSLDPGETVELSVVVDRTDLTNGVTYTELDVVSEAPLAHGDKVWPIFVRVEKAEITEVAVGPQVICALQSPGPGPKVATIRATGLHVQKATSVWAVLDTPAGEVLEALGYDMDNQRWITTYSSTTIGLHVVSAHAVGSQAISVEAGAVPVHVIWCP